ncbi:MAG: hypothetical protein HY738_22465 [Bacteroidia bacterium]|nr:hypothetical protein [Bacteroidia bacterium]
MEIILVPRPLREKLGEEASDNLVELINKANGVVKQDTISLCSDKFERRLIEETTKLDKRITEEIQGLRVEMYRLHTVNIRWMFIFWIGQIGAILAILFAFFKN